MENIETFNRGVTLILAWAYARFPVPGVLNLDAIDTGDDVFPVEDKLKVMEFRQKIYVATVGYLADEGFLRFRDHVGLQFSAVVLTSKGLATLNRIPESLTPTNPPRKTIGEWMIETASRLGQSATTQAIGEAVKTAAHLVLGG